AASRPVNVRAVVENNVDEGDAEEGEAAHHLRFWHRQHRGCKRIGHLVLDYLRRLTRISGVDNDLRVGKIGDGIERQVTQGVNAPGRSHERGDQHNHDVARRPINNPGDHWVSPAARLCSAALRLLSASIRKLAAVTTLSPSEMPSLIST